MFRNCMEDCLSFGKPMLIENIEEELDPVLDPVLERRLIKKGKMYVMPLADKEVDFTETFRLFVTTRLPNPHFTPELSAKVRTHLEEVHSLTYWVQMCSKKHTCWLPMTVIL